MAPSRRCPGWRWLALGWCHKRIGRIDLAIESLEEALSAEPRDALVHYNLACYWSLAANASKALEELTVALHLKPELRRLISDESDFNTLRGNSTFERLMRDAAPSK